MSVECRLRPLIAQVLAARREEQRATWELDDAIDALAAAVKARRGVAEALAAVRRAEARKASLVAAQKRWYQEILNTAPSEVR